MEELSIEEKEERDDAWIYEVAVGTEPMVTIHRVTVPKEYSIALTNGKYAPTELVRKSFEFLLAREPREAILQEFELPVIQQYFPEYEEEVREMLEHD